jgi:hypothetical protein
MIHAGEIVFLRDGGGYGNGGVVPGTIRAIALLAVLPLTGLGVGAPGTVAYADDCLAAPNSTAPQGSHWCYRIDRAKKLKCWYLRALDESGQQTAVGAISGIAPTPRPQSTDAPSASLPVPSIDAPISVIPAESARPLKKLAAKPQPGTSTARNADPETRGQDGTLAPSIPQARALQGSSRAAGSNPTTKSATRDATPDGDAEPSGRPAASIPQIPALQKDAPEAAGFNTAPISAPPDATSNADVEKSGLEGSLASPIPQAAVLQKDASPVDASNPTPVTGTSVEPAEEVGELMFKSADQASDNAQDTVEATNTHAVIAFRNKWNISSMGSLAAMPTVETVAVLMLGIALAGILSGVLLMIVETRRVADHAESSLINDRNQLVRGETDLEAALLANMMALWRPPEAKRSDGAKPFLLAPIGSGLSRRAASDNA